MALYSGKAFCRRRQCCRSAGTCHSKVCNISELSGAVHDGSCCRFAAASVHVFRLEVGTLFQWGRPTFNLFPFLAFLSRSTPQERHRGILAMKMTTQAVCMHISRICTSLLGLGLGCGGNYFYSEVRYRFSSGSNY